MNCYICNSTLIWGNDEYCEDDEDHSIVTNFTCPKCNSFTLVYQSREEEEKEC